MLSSRESWSPHKFILINLCPICYWLDQTEMDGISEAGILLLTLPDGIFNTWKYQRSKFKGRSVKSLSPFQEKGAIPVIYISSLQKSVWNHFLLLFGLYSHLTSRACYIAPKYTTSFQLFHIILQVFINKSIECLPFSRPVFLFKAVSFIINFQRANQSH